MAKFTWDAAKRVYKKNGKPVTDEVCYQWLREATDNAEKRMIALSEKFLAGKLSQVEWSLAVRAEIRAGHRAMFQLANGSSQLTPKQLGLLGNVVKQQYGWFQGFEKDVESGKTANAALTARSRLYASSVYCTYENAVAVREAEAGMKYVEWILGDAVHCEGRGSCPEQAKRGRVLIKNSPPIGSRNCVVRCRCRKKYFAKKKD